MKRYLVGIYGGIGSGKSYALNFLKGLGANVLSCDEENKALLSDPEYLDKIRPLFPNAVGLTVDKDKIKNAIFNDESKRIALEKIAHNEIKKRILQKAKEGVWFIEIPIFKKNYLPIDKSWVIDCPIRIKLERILERDGISQELALKIINTQPIIEADNYTLISNDGSIKEFEEKIKTEYNIITEKCSD